MKEWLGNQAAGFGGTVYWEDTWRSFAPSGTIGYRFQKPGKRFVFRTGAGFPYGLYVGIGFRF